MSIAFRNLYILAFGVFAVLNTELGIVGVLPQLAQVTGKTISQVGYLISVFALTVTFIGPIFTIFALKLNQKRALILAQLLLFISNVIPILFPNYTAMMIARFLGGLGHPLFFTLALSYPSYTLPSEKQARAMSIILGGVNVAFIVGFPIISFLATSFSWKAGFTFSMIANLVAILGIMFCIPKTTPNQDASDPVTFSSFKERGFIISIPVLIILFAGNFIMYSYFSPFLKEIWHINPHDLTVALICFGIFGLLGNILTGLVSPKKTSSTLILYIILFIGIYTLLSFSSLNAPLLAIIGAWGFLQSGIFLLGQLWFTFNKTTHVEAVNSALVSSANFGITIGSFIGGVTISQFGIHLLPFVGIVILILVIVGILINSKIYKKTL